MAGASPGVTRGMMELLDAILVSGRVFFLCVEMVEKGVFHQFWWHISGRERRGARVNRKTLRWEGILGGSAFG